MRKKRRAQNLMMAAALVLIAAMAFFAVGSVKGWFSNTANTAFLRDIRGIVIVERSGVRYPAEGETAVRSGDRLICDTGASAVIDLQSGSIALGENAEIMVENANIGGFSANVLLGEIFIDVQNPVRLSFDENVISVFDMVALLHVSGDSQTLCVLKGDNVGKTLLWQGRDQQISDIDLSVFSDFALNQIRTANESHTLCISNEDLNPENSVQLENDGVLSCTVAIYCDTILDNMDQLDTAKASYVPVDGVILAPTQVQFEAGETVFDVLTRICEACEIQIEYSWTPLYDSYYIEGIHHLYEFDCGSQSGWMYKVNECFPNYGCSEYKLTGGEAIVWCYTCKGLGADVGGTF